MHTMNTRIGAAIARLREQQGLTQTELGAAVGVHRTTINKIEKGKGNHRHNVLQAIATALHVNLSEITGESAASSGLSHDALWIAQLYDSLPVEDRAALKRLLWHFEKEPPSRR